MLPSVPTVMPLGVSSWPGSLPRPPPFGLEDQTAEWELGGHRLRRFHRLDRVAH